MSPRPRITGSYAPATRARVLRVTHWVSPARRADGSVPAVTRVDRYERSEDWSDSLDCRHRSRAGQDIPAVWPAAMRDNHDMSAFPPLETVEEIKRLFEAGIPKDAPDRNQRLGWASQLAQLMVRVGELRYRQARGRNIAHVLARLAAGVT